MTAQRVLGLVVLLAAGVFSLPLAAIPFDGEGSENWILPLHLGGMAIIGAGVSLLVPGLVGEEASQAKRVWVGAAIGVGMALLGVAVFFLLLNGFSGA